MHNQYVLHGSRTRQYFEIDLETADGDVIDTKVYAGPDPTDLESVRVAHVNYRPDLETVLVYLHDGRLLYVPYGTIRKAQPYLTQWQTNESSDLVQYLKSHDALPEDTTRQPEWFATNPTVGEPLSLCRTRINNLVYQ